jgi:hypothetical protein
MKKPLLFVASLGLVCAALAGPDMRPQGPHATPPGSPATPGSPVAAPLDNGPVTPLAITVLEWGIPFSRGWNVYGLRLNLSAPGWHAGHHDLYGIDAGTCGELTGDGAGIQCNVFDNICDNFGGFQVSGFYNRIKGEAPFAFQITTLHNQARTINGLQVGCWNLATQLRGLQLGLINHAESGAGVQIGLWNECGTTGSPILGAIY